MEHVRFVTLPIPCFPEGQACVCVCACVCVHRLGKPLTTKLLPHPCTFTQELSAGFNEAYSQVNCAQGSALKSRLPLGKQHGGNVNKGPESQPPRIMGILLFSQSHCSTQNENWRGGWKLWNDLRPFHNWTFPFWVEEGRSIPELGNLSFPHQGK